MDKSLLKYLFTDGIFVSGFTSMFMGDAESLRVAAGVPGHLVPPLSSWNMLLCKGPQSSSTPQPSAEHGLVDGRFELSSWWEPEAPWFS